MIEVESSSAIVYNEIKNDPRKLLLLLNKFVKVELIKKMAIEGFIHSIDPITHSLILIEPKDEAFQTTIIPGHAILNILELKSTKIKQPPIREMDATASEINNEKRRKKIISWFEQNLLSVSVSDDNIVFGNVLILPPYSVNDVCTDSPIIARQVINIIQNMPDI